MSQFSLHNEELRIFNLSNFCLFKKSFNFFFSFLDLEFWENASSQGAGSFGPWHAYWDFFLAGSI